MSGTMSQDDLVSDLKESLHDAAAVFASDDDAAFKRFLAQALPDLSIKRPVTKLAQVTLVEAQASYALDAYTDFGAYKTHLWGSGRVTPRPWEPNYPGAMPRIRAQQEGAGWALVLDPAPTLVQMSAWGSTCKFWYFSTLVIEQAANDTTVPVAARGLLLLRAQAEAMRELAIHQANKPVSMRDGLSGTPRNSTPAALHEMLLRLFWESA